MSIYSIQASQIDWAVAWERVDSPTLVASKEISRIGFV
jgi:hypothetical protein